MISILRRHRVVLDWRATDADGPELRFRVEFRAGHRSWRSLAVDTGARWFVVPRRTLPRTRVAHLRIRVSDGFNEAFVTSRRFRVQ